MACFIIGDSRMARSWELILQRSCRIELEGWCWMAFPVSPSLNAFECSLTGGLDSGDYTGGLDKWGKSSMRDSNKVYEQFFVKCAEAGSERCALAARSPSKLVNEDEEAFIKRAAKDLQVNADQFISELWDTPMQVEEGQNGPGLLTAQDLSFVVSQSTFMGVSVLTL